MNILKKFNPTYLTQNAIETLTRFPFVMLFSVLTGIMIEIYQYDSKIVNINVILTSCIGISSFLALKLYLEQSPEQKLFWSLHASLIVLLGVIYWLNPNDIDSSFFRLVQLLFAAHLLVALAPFLKDHKTNSFWFYNQGLFIRFFISCVYTGVLLLGTAAILRTIHSLFHIEIPNEMYRYASLICIFFFHPLHFLNGIPEDFSELEYKTDFPKTVRIFGQYLLVPLVCIYGIILITYCVTIIAAQEWPKGVISSLVVGYSIVGIFTQLMIYPLINPNNSWAIKFFRLLNATLIILSFVILAAVARRIKDYGITESRYFLIITALWLMMMSAYLILGKKRDIRLVPISLLLVTFLTAFGPWGAYSLSLRLQMARLEKILERNKILVQDKINRIHPEVSWTDRDDITQILDYVIKRHGTKSIRGLYPSNAFPDTNLLSVQSFMDAMNITPTRNKNVVQSFYLHGVDEIKTEGLQNISVLNSAAPSRIHAPWEIAMKSLNFIIRHKGKIVFSEPHDEMFKRLGITRENTSSHKLSPLTFNYDGRKAILYFTEFSGQFPKEGKTGEIYSYRGFIIY